MNPVILHRWMDDAACTTTDPDLFFPEHGDTHAADNAKRICAGCDVKQTCEAYAIEHSIVPGIWGGRAYKARRRVIENKRKRDAA